MELQKLITKVAEWIPQSLRVALRGQHGSPRRFANVIHGILNRAPVDRYPILSCGGPLKGYRMRIDWQIHRAFVYGSWEPEVTRAIEENTRLGMTALDIGAQSGFYTLLLSKLVGSKGKVIAFEPLPANYRLLDENVGLNRLQNVIVVHQAVADHTGEISFQFPTHEASLIAGPVLESDKQGTFSVDCVSLDDFASGRQVNVDLIKMDVEGAEDSVLEGALRSLEQFHPVLIIELHHDGGQPRRHPVPIRLQALGYTIEWLSERQLTSHIRATWPMQDVVKSTSNETHSSTTE